MEHSKNGDLKTQLFQKYSLVLHAYFGRDMDTFVALLDKDFVGIGSYKAQFTKGIQEFLAVSHNEQMEPPAEVYDEEYQILFGEQNIWIVYGQFRTSAQRDETMILHTYQRGTYVWKLENKEFKLLHFHCSMVRDESFEGSADVKVQKNLRWYDYMILVEKNRFQKQHFFLQDGNGGIRYLLPEQVLYVSMSYRVATVYTLSGSFTTNRKLGQLLEVMPFLLQTHKSWLVNPLYVTEIRRYYVTLSNKTEIPVGKSKYNEVYEALAKR